MVEELTRDYTKLHGYSNMQITRKIFFFLSHSSHLKIVPILVD